MEVLVSQDNLLLVFQYRNYVLYQRLNSLPQLRSHGDFDTNCGQNRFHPYPKEILNILSWIIINGQHLTSFLLIILVWCQMVEMNWIYPSSFTSKGWENDSGVGRVGKFLQQVGSFFGDAAALQSQLAICLLQSKHKHTQMTNITSKKRQTFTNDERCCKGET